MCGIVGYIGNNVKENLIKGLEKLEYRGYDSAGMVISNNNEFIVEKAVGEVEKLKKKLNDKDYTGLGIAHTRWATHGEISINNCHPHFSSDGNVALVHNGIIENFENLKSYLEKNEKYFYGQTDSEVIAKMFDGELSLNKIKDVIDKLKGAYALAIISKKNDEIFFAKNKSPLYVAKGNDCFYVASDPSVFSERCQEFYSIEDGEYGCISVQGIEIYNKEGKINEKIAKEIDFDFTTSNKEQYNHFMLKEINESNKVLENIIAFYEKEEAFENLKSFDVKKYNRIYLVGCGTAYHAGLIGEKYFKERLNIDCFTRKASEFIYQNDIINENSLCIFISQSGETADTISALEYVKNFNATTLSLVNVTYSTLASKSDYVLNICAGQEKAVASTKAYLAQCLVLLILAKYFIKEDFLSVLKDFQFDYGNDDLIIPLAKHLHNHEKIFFIGRGFDYITALEASLKLKEISYIFSCAECSGELKHGSLALIDNGLPVIVIANDESCFAKTLNNAYEVKSRGGELILFSSIDIDKEIENNFKYIIPINKCKDDLMPIQTIISLQKLAYYVAVERNLNPDKPRNLAKSVTVE